MAPFAYFTFKVPRRAVFVSVAPRPSLWCATLAPQEHDLINEFNVAVPKLFSFFRRIQAKYLPTPYHNVSLPCLPPPHIRRCCEG